MHVLPIGFVLKAYKNSLLKTVQAVWHLIMRCEHHKKDQQI